MTAVGQSQGEVRAAITTAHDRVWASIASPGATLPGPKRCAIVSEARAAGSCSLCSQRKQAIAPTQVDGRHSSPSLRAGLLTEAEVEIVHKIVADPGRVTKTWVDQQLASGISDSAYVEIASLVCLIRVVDTFRKGVGLPMLAEPDPLLGDPSGYRPPSAADEGAFVPMIPINGLDEDTSDLFNSRAFVPNVQRAFSLVPDSTRLANQLMQSHYLDYQSVTQYTDDDHDRSISKAQMELVATQVSLYNDCFY